MKCASPWGLAKTRTPPVSGLQIETVMSNGIPVYDVSYNIYAMISSLGINWISFDCAAVSTFLKHEKKFYAINQSIDKAGKRNEHSFIYSNHEPMRFSILELFRVEPLNAQTAQAPFRPELISTSEYFLNIVLWYSPPEVIGLTLSIPSRGTTNRTDTSNQSFLRNPNAFMAYSEVCWNGLVFLFPCQDF